jgi:hypothetical protein
MFAGRLYIPDIYQVYTSNLPIYQIDIRYIGYHLLPMLASVACQPQTRYFMLILSLLATESQPKLGLGILFI